MTAVAGWQDDTCPHRCMCTSDDECPHDCPSTDPGEAWQDEQERRQTAGWENGDDVRDPWPTVQIDERGRIL